MDLISKDKQALACPLRFKREANPLDYLRTLHQENGSEQ
jgi:hypothetical protein